MYDIHDSIDGDNCRDSSSIDYPTHPANDDKVLSMTQENAIEMSKYGNPHGGLSGG